LEGVKLVDGDQITKIDDSGYYSRSESGLLRIAFSSATNLEKASEGGDLYVNADFCPFDMSSIMSAGPFYNDKNRYLPAETVSGEGTNGHVIQNVSSANRQPTRDLKTGRYIYTAYIYPVGKERIGHGLPPRPAYDLRSESNDICVRLQRTGYFITKSVSDVFVIPASRIDAALQAPESKRAPKAP
jgi:hypothetical protein